MTSASRRQFIGGLTAFAGTRLFAAPAGSLKLGEPDLRFGVRRLMVRRETIMRKLWTVTGLLVMAYAVTAEVKWPLLDASDRAFYDAIYAPTIVGEQPDHTHKEMVRLPDGELRYYGTDLLNGVRTNVYLVSRDRGLNWKERLRNTKHDLGAMAYCPWGDFYFRGDWFEKEGRTFLKYVRTKGGPTDLATKVEKTFPIPAALSVPVEAATLGAAAKWTKFKLRWDWTAGKAALVANGGETPFGFSTEDFSPYGPSYLHVQTRATGHDPKGTYFRSFRMTAK